jgi:DNA-binding transcriptional LysR family regulator
MVSTVELREIRVFLVLAEELHYGRTADRLRLTPSRVSQIVRTLEARIGGRLFERTSRRVRLTPLGEQLHRDLDPVYRQLQTVLSDAHDAATGLAGTLRIGSYSPVGCGPRWLEIVDTFKARHPACDVAFIDTGLEREFLDWLRAGDADMLVARLPLTDPDISVGPILTREPRVLAVAKRDPLAQRGSVSYEDLADRVVLDLRQLPREMMEAFIPPRTPSGKTIARVTNRSIEEAMMRVAAGSQVHPTVPSWIEFHTHRDTVAVPIRDLPPSETALVWLTVNRSAKIEAFARAATDVLADEAIADHGPAEAVLTNASER